MKNRWVSLAAGVLIQTILGGIYAWSTFIPRLGNAYGLTKGQGGFIFGLSIAVFTVTMTMAGRFLSVRSPQLTAGISAVLYTAGFVLASFTDGSFMLLLLSLGIITGVGIGFGYVCPLTVGMKWFPKNKGLVTGIAVAGFGGGAIFLSTVAEYFFKSGVDVLPFFRWWGLFSGAILFMASLFLTEPANSQGGPQKRVEYGGALTVPFGLCSAGILAGTFAGLLINGNLASLVAEAGVTQHRIALSISLFAVGNALGRIVWGYIFDRLGYLSIPLSLLCFAFAVIALFTNLSEWQHLLTVGFLGFCFGANFVVYASAIARFFGQSSFSTLYPLCFLFYGFAGLVGPGIGGYLADLTGSYKIPLFVSATVLVLAGGLSFAKLSAFDTEAASAARMPADGNQE